MQSQTLYLKENMSLSHRAKSHGNGLITVNKIGVMLQAHRNSVTRVSSIAWRLSCQNKKQNGARRTRRLWRRTSCWGLEEERLCWQCSGERDTRWGRWETVSVSAFTHACSLITPSCLYRTLHSVLIDCFTSEPNSTVLSRLLWGVDF